VEDAFWIAFGTWAYHMLSLRAASRRWRKDLPELIAHAESLGHITGLNTNGRRLADAAFGARTLLRLDLIMSRSPSSQRCRHP